MSKFLFATLALGLSFASMAEVSLHSKVLKQHCKIANGKVTVSTSFDAKDTLSATSSRAVEVKGIEGMVRSAALRASGRTELGFTYYAMLDGQKISLNTTDSEESVSLVRMMTKLCY